MQQKKINVTDIPELLKATRFLKILHTENLDEMDRIGIINFYYRTKIVRKLWKIILILGCPRSKKWELKSLYTGCIHLILKRQVRIKKSVHRLYPFDIEKAKKKGENILQGIAVYSLTFDVMHWKAVDRIDYSWE